MPTSLQRHLLCRYDYDALDRSINWAPIRQAGIQRFYCINKLATEIQDRVKHSIFQHGNQVLAQQQNMDDKVNTTLLATDLQRSVLNALDADRAHPIAYSPYGHRLPGNGLLSLLGFSGERPDPITGHYHLGNGYRQFNPVLMRFNSPDSLSPFGKGGLNAYVYCAGDPVNRVDSDGRAWEKLIKLMNSNIAKNTERHALSIHTIHAIEKMTRKTGEKEIIKRAKLMKEKPERYLVKNLILKYQIKPNHYPKNFIPQTTSEISNLINQTRSTTLKLQKRIDILSDIEIGYPGKYANTINLEYLREAHTQQIQYSTRLSESLKGWDAPPAYEPPPSYNEATQKIRQ